MSAHHTANSRLKKLQDLFLMRAKDTSRNNKATRGVFHFQSLALLVKRERQASKPSYDITNKQTDSLYNTKGFSICKEKQVVKATATTIMPKQPRQDYSIIFKTNYKLLSTTRTAIPRTSCRLMPGCDEEQEAHMAVLVSKKLLPPTTT